MSSAAAAVFGAADGEEDTAAWIIGRPAVLVIDMQYDFVDPSGACPTPGAEAIIEPIRGLVAAAHGVGVPVVYSQEAHRAGGVDLGREVDPGTGASYAGDQVAPLPSHCVEGTPGLEIIDLLAPSRDDLLVRKRRYSCFFGTDLDLLLRSRGVSTLLITGVCSNACVLWTAGDAFQRDYHVRLISDCVAGTDQQQHDAALAIIRSLTGRPPATSEQMCAALANLHP